MLFNQVCNDEDVPGDWCHLYEGFVISCVNGLCRYIFVYYHVTAIVWCTTWFHWRPAMCSCLSCISICHAILNQWQLLSTKCCQTASLCWYATSYDLIHSLSVCLSVCYYRYEIFVNEYTSSFGPWNWITVADVDYPWTGLHHTWLIAISMMKTVILNQAFYTWLVESLSVLSLVQDYF